MARVSVGKILSATLAGLAGLVLSTGLAFAQAAETGSADSGSTAPKSDWSKRCNDKGVCIIQTGLEDNQGKLIAALALARNPTDGLVGEIRSPLGLHIPSGLNAVVDTDGLQFAPRLITCFPRSCLSAFRATDEVIGAFQKGGRLNVTFLEVRTGQKVTLGFSLIGFSAQYKDF